MEQFEPLLLASGSRTASTETGYKVLARADNGGLASLFDNSQYELGEWRAQLARPNHGGGFYYCRTQEWARDYIYYETVAGSAPGTGRELVLCEVEVAGRKVEYDFHTRAATRLRVVRELTGMS